MSEGRALLTEREREALAGDKTDNYRYKTRTYFRDRLERLAGDVDHLAEHDPVLLEELRRVVCDDTDGASVATTSEPATGAEPPEPRDTDDSDDEIAALVEELPIPGGGPKLKGRRETVGAMLRELRAHGERDTEHLEAVAEEHAHGYGSVGSFMSNTWRGKVMPALRERGVADADSSGTYYWVGEGV